MKVAIVHGLLRGGAARRVAGTVEALLVDPDLELQVFSLAGSYPVAAGTIETALRLEAPSRNRILRPFWRYVDLLSVRRTWGQLWDAVDGWAPDAVFANPCAEPGGAPPGFRRSAAPIVYYCDEPRRVDYERAAARASNPATRVPYAAMRRLQRHDERRSVAAATTLLTNSRFTADRIRRAYGRDAEVVTPGIALSFTSSGESPVSFEARTHLLSVGTLIPSKGHDLAIRAVAASGAGLPLIVVAPRADQQEAIRLATLASSLGVHLEIRTGITDGQLLALYRSALATLYLAVEEPLGLASLESQACGTPVVVADDGGLVETLEVGVTGFAVARDGVAAGATLALLLDPQRHQEFAQAAAARPVPRDSDAARAVTHVLRAVASGAAVRVSGS